MTAIVPHWSYGVNYVLGVQITGLCEDSGAGRASVWVLLSCGLHDCATATSVDRSINTAPARQTGIGRVDDRVDLLLRDISVDQFESG